MENILEKLYDNFYNKLDDDYSRGETIELLLNESRATQIAVIFGDLNYQVGNGGWLQYIGNEYFRYDYDLFNELIRELLEKENTYALQGLAGIIEEVEEYDDALSTVEEKLEGWGECDEDLCYEFLRNALEKGIDKLSEDYFKISNRVLEELETILNNMEQEA